MADRGLGKIVPVILCGGAGTRLWPVSRANNPKQFHALTGTQTLLQQTAQRVAGADFAEPIIVTGEEHRFRVAEQMREIGMYATIVLEPERRDSCAAVVAAAAVAARGDGGAIMLVLAADHAIGETQRFHDAIHRAVPAAAAGYIVTFGVQPSEPATGYGYIRPGPELTDHPGVRAVGAFVEKPDADTAAAHLRDGYLWNSGNFLFRARTMLDTAERLVPEIAGPVLQSVEQANIDLDFLRLEPEAFRRARAASLDYAIMEACDRTAVVTTDFNWSDVGSWDAVWRLTDKDAKANASTGPAIFRNASNNLVFAPETLAVVIGLDNMIVVVNGDAVLISSRAGLAELKSVVEGIGHDRHGAVATRHADYRPWGAFWRIDRGARYQVKRIAVRPGGRVSLQRHKHRSEHWVVVSGVATVTIGDDTFELLANQSTYIPAGSVHRLENRTDQPLELIEVQSGDYLGEDDIERLDDVYGRD